jgi:beta-galactosidase beta subunit
VIVDATGNLGRYRGTHRGIDRALTFLETVPWLIQLILQGAETIYWAPAADLEPDGEYDRAGDIRYFRDPGPPSGAGGAAPAMAPLRIHPGLFVLLYPEDAHKPGRIWGTPQRVRKAVLKVRL